MNGWRCPNVVYLQNTIKVLIYGWVVPGLLLLSSLPGITGQSQAVSRHSSPNTDGIGKYSAETCETIPISTATSPGDLALRCHLRTINSEFDKTNFSRIQGDAKFIVSLRLECSDILFYQSTLLAGSFSHLYRLANLQIEHCKLNRLPQGVFTGLSSHLKNLTVQTHNTAWPALSLDIAAGVFDHLPNLESIDLSANNIWTFPERLFCPAIALQSLNVSSNRLQDISDLSFRHKESGSKSYEGCKIGIKILDVSGNRLILLPPAGLSTLSQLKELYLEGNEISVVSADALVGVKMLKILNLAANKISGLPQDVFRDVPEISEVYLQNNSLSSLAPSVLQHLNELVILDLSRNSLTSEWMNSEGDESTNTGTGVPGTFSGLIRLVVLNLSYNRLTHLSSATFSDLYSLQILNMEHNLVQSIEANVFSPMKNLHTLILSHNSLTTIDATSFNGLFVLSLLSLDNNNITTIDPSAFNNCSSLKDLNLNGNSLLEIPIALQNLTFLKTVDLGENLIEKLEEKILIGLPNLYGLRLTENRVTNVTKAALLDLPSLKVLNLARNRIQQVEEGAFDSNTNLQAVRLDSNFLTDISNLFVQSPNLIWLNISDNQLTWFDYSLIPKQLQWLDLHKNEISDLGNYERMDLRLQTLDASFNRITKLSALNIPDSMELLFMNDNLISQVEPHTFYNKLNLSRVDIFANQIETLELNSLRLSPVAEGRSLPEFFIGGNPITCDCNMEWLQRINKMNHLRQHPKIMDLDSVYCRLMYHRHNYYVPLIQADPSQFLCSYRSHCFASCHCCDFDACDCQMTCPNNCTCYHDDMWSSNTVDCAARGHTQIPSGIPMDSTEVYLDGNYFEELSSHLFIGRKNLQVLYLNYSSIDRISNNSFTGLKRLLTLHLENNFLVELRGYEFESLDNLRELYLQGNQLTYIADTTFANLRSLEVLKLNGNRLTRFSMWTLSQNPYLVEIALYDNTWSCECDYVPRAAKWVRTNLAKLVDSSKLNCYIDDIPLQLAYINGSKCYEIAAAEPGAVEFPESAEFSTSLLLMGSALLLSLMFGFIVFLICRREKSFRIWAAMKSPLTLCSYESARDIEDGEKLYDAYVAYSVKDEVWVSQVMAAELQQMQQTQTKSSMYRLCLHHKDFQMTSYIADTIVGAVESSKRTILILSKNFLQSEWCRFEFKAALNSALRGKKNRLIAITLSDFDTIRDLDPDLRVLLSSVTILSANDKLFWKKLKHFLPNPRDSYYTNTGSHRGRISPATPIPASYPSPHNQNVFNNVCGNGNGNNYHYPTSPRSAFEGIDQGHGHSRCPNFRSTLNNSILNSSCSSSIPVPLYMPPFPPPNRPPPPFPTNSCPRRPPINRPQECPSFYSGGEESNY